MRKTWTNHEFKILTEQLTIELIAQNNLRINVMLV